MRPHRAIAHAFGDWVGLGPDDVRSQIPGVRLECKRNSPWDTDQVLGLEAWRPDPAVTHRAGGLPVADSAERGGPPRVGTRVGAVADTDPNRSLWRADPAALPRDAPP